MSVTTAQAPFIIRNMLSASKNSTSLQCPLCQQSDSALHILSGCQHNIISGMITECHNVACRLITNAISKGSMAGCIVHMDAGSTDCFAQQNLQILSTLVIGLYPFGFLMLVYPSETGSLLVVLMLFLLLPYLPSPDHLPLPTRNRCSMLDLMDKCAELTNLTLIRGRYTSYK